LLTDRLIYAAFSVAVPKLQDDESKESEVCHSFKTSARHHTLLMKLFVVLSNLYDAIQPWSFWRGIFVAMYNELSLKDGPNKVLP
jgi:hypothetical protein